MTIDVFPMPAKQKRGKGPRGKREVRRLRERLEEEREQDRLGFFGGYVPKERDDGR